MAETKYVDALASINFEKDLMLDSSCGHHLTKDQSKFSSPQSTMEMKPKSCPIL